MVVILDVTGCFIRSFQKILVRCRNFDKIIRSSVLYFLPDFLHLEVHCFGVKGDRRRDIWDGPAGILEDSIEHCV